MPPLIVVRQAPTGAVAVCLWLSGEEYESETGAADRFEPISRGPDAFQRLVATVQAWEAEFPEAIVDSEIPLVAPPTSQEEPTPADGQLRLRL